MNVTHIQEIFDQHINRTGTGSVKVDGLKEYFGDNDLVPMWVADMDFQVPSCVTNAIRERADHPIYGYTLITPGFYNAVTNWLKIRHDWDVPAEWVLFSPGIVPSLSISVLTFTDPGDKVLLQSPVYPPFFSSIREYNRTIVNNQLIEKDGRYLIDFDDLEKKLARNVKMMFFCNPHNPVGRVWNRKEVQQVVSLCNRYNVILISDEIHSDLVLSGHRHIPAASAGKVNNNMVICMAPSKTFNLAGLASSFLVIPDKELREKIKGFAGNLHINSGNIFGLVALQAAYEGGGEWLDGLIKYLQANRDTVKRFFNDELPEIRPVPTEGTYLLWLDCRRTGLSDLKLKRFFIKQAGIAMNPGTSFGSGGSGFFRMNIACPRSTLLNALDKIYTSWNSK
jgi:cysteine-S-conjugate beta-lyase